MIKQTLPLFPLSIIMVRFPGICFLMLVLFTQCRTSEKDKENVVPLTTCINPDALNYSKTGKCTYPKDSILGMHEVVITESTYQNDTGDVFTIEVTDGVCYRYVKDSSYKVLHFKAHGTGWFYPDEFCVVSDGYDFTIAETDSVTWALAPLTGTGSFSNKKFQFTGTVQTSSGPYRLTIKSR